MGTYTRLTRDLNGPAEVVGQLTRYSQPKPQPGHLTAGIGQLLKGLEDVLHLVLGNSDSGIFNFNIYIPLMGGPVCLDCNLSLLSE